MLPASYYKPQFLSKTANTHRHTDAHVMWANLLLQDAAGIKVPPLGFMTCERVSWWEQERRGCRRVMQGTQSCGELRWHSEVPFLTMPTWAQALLTVTMLKSGNISNQVRNIHYGRWKEVPTANFRCFLNNRSKEMSNNDFLSCQASGEYGHDIHLHWDSDCSGLCSGECSGGAGGVCEPVSPQRHLLLHCVSGRGWYHCGTFGDSSSHHHQPAILHSVLHMPLPLLPDTDDHPELHLFPDGDSHRQISASQNSHQVRNWFKSIYLDLFSFLVQWMFRNYSISLVNDGVFRPSFTLFKRENKRKLMSASSLTDSNCLIQSIMASLFNELGKLVPHWSILSTKFYTLFTLFMTINVACVIWTWNSRNCGTFINNRFFTVFCIRESNLCSVKWIRFLVLMSDIQERHISLPDAMQVNGLDIKSF